MSINQLSPDATSELTLQSPKVVLYTRLRKSPFFWASRRYSPKAYSVYNHMYHVRYYDDPIAEYWRLLSGVTLWDVGVERQIEITGPDAFTFVNSLTPRDLTRCAVGQCKYVVLTAPDGGIINDPVLLRLGENHFWLSIADSDVLLWAKGVAYKSGLSVEIKEADVGPVQVQGPQSKALMEHLFDSQVVEMPYYHLREAQLDGMDVVVSRTGYSAEVGYEIYLRNSTRDGVKLWDTIMEAGRPFDIAPIGPCHIRRIEAGMLAYGADMTLHTNPYEVGLGWMVKLQQEEDFIGKQALRAIKDRGVSRKLVGIEIGGEQLGSYHDGSMIDVWPVWHGNEQVGVVTSACYSPRLEKNIGYALVPVEYAETGAGLTVEVPASYAEATVVPKPFIDPKKEMPKS